MDSQMHNQKGIRGLDQAQNCGLRRLAGAEDRSRLQTLVLSLAGRTTWALAWRLALDWKPELIKAMMQIC